MEGETTVITFGTFDLFHIGHLRILQRAQTYGDKLVVGVSSDEFNYRKKQKCPIFSEKERMSIVNNIKGVDTVFLEEDMELKRQYILDNKADILVMGDDWKGRFDHLNDICKVVYLPRTPEISTTDLFAKIRDGYEKIHL